VTFTGQDEWPEPDIEQVYRGSFHPFVTMRGCGLLSRVRETVAFFQLLSFSSWHLAIMRNNEPSDFSLQYAAKASRKLQDQIFDQTTPITVDLILAVFVFANSTVSYCFRAHRQSIVNELFRLK
jgi:hypothetical protein